MTVAYQRLAAVRPANTNEQDLYALASGQLVGVIHVCNQAASAKTFSIAITDAAAGQAATGEDWIEYETEIDAKVTHRIKIEGLKATATVRIVASAADVISFVLEGMLVT